jgi:hypothetical protein
MEKMICPVCGKLAVPMYVNGECSNECFTKGFWQETLNDTAIIINGKCYHVGDEDDTSCFRGFGGARYKIQMNDGRIIETTNLWTNGIIPEEFARPDNAKFIR